MRLGSLLSSVLCLTAGVSAAEPPASNSSPRPPLGWDPAGVYGGSATDAEILANAHYLHDKLLPHGWNTVALGASAGRDGSARSSLAASIHQLGLNFVLSAAPREIADRWADVNQIFELLARASASRGLGHGFDVGLIPLGHVAVRNSAAGPDRPTRLTRDEQITLLSLADLASSPLLLSMNLPDSDEWTGSLLSNDEALAIDQDRGGQPVRRVVRRGTSEVWAKPLADGDLALGFFNRGEQTTTVVAFWPEAGLTGPCWVRDIWNLQDRPEADRGLEVEVTPHGAVLVRLHPLTPKAG
jgi:hypothetical protein